MASPNQAPPHDLDAEASVLGAILLRPEAFYDIAEVVAAEDFFEPKHAAIFGAMARLSTAGDPIDQVLLARELKAADQLDLVGGVGALFGFTTWVADSRNVRHHAELVREKSVLRRVAQAGAQMEAEALAGGDAAEVIDRAERTVFDLAMGRRSNELTPTPVIVQEVYKRIEALADRKSSITGIPSGIDALDDMTAGFQDSDLIIVAGRPGTGKTSAALGWLFYAASEFKKPGLAFSLEMSKEQLVTRLISREGRMSSHQLRTGLFNDQDWPKMLRACSKISEAPFHIDDRSVTLLDIRTRCRRQAASNEGLGMVVIDYLQLMRGEPGVQNRDIEIGQISRGLKLMAKELQVPVIALSQLNRSLESRKDKRPMLSDLRESGSIEGDADMVIFVYRDELYAPDAHDGAGEFPPNKNIAELIIGKQRNGATGAAYAAFFGEYTAFENLEPSAAERYRAYVGGGD